MNRLRTNLGGNVERSSLLDLARLQCDFCKVESGTLRHLNEFKLCAVASSSQSPKRTLQGSLDGEFLRSPKAHSQAGTLYPHEVPARLADHRVEYRRKDRFDEEPGLSDGFLERIQAIRQDAPFAEKNRMQLHFVAPLEGAGDGGAIGAFELAAGVPGLSEILCSTE
jgi:hypothetical protein